MLYLGRVSIWASAFYLLLGVLLVVSMYPTAIVAGLAIFASVWFQSRSSSVAVTNRRVIANYGWIRRVTLELNLSHIEGVSVYQGLFAQLLGFGTVQLSGAGSMKQPLRHIVTPGEFRRAVVSAQNGLSYRQPPDSGWDQAAAAGKWVALSLVLILSGYGLMHWTERRDEIMSALLSHPAPAGKSPSSSPVLQPLPTAVLPTAPTAAGPAPAETPDPSFGCEGALGRIERLICGSAELSKLETDAARAYQSYLDALSHGPGKSPTQSDPAAWRRAVQSRCNAAPCLHTALLKRIDDLERAAQPAPAVSMATPKASRAIAAPATLPAPTESPDPSPESKEATSDERRDTTAEAPDMNNTPCGYMCRVKAETEGSSDGFSIQRCIERCQKN